MEMQKITDLQFQSILEQDDISDIHFVWVNFSNHNFSFKIFSSCHFEKCNLSNVVLKNTTLNDVTFINCKILGLKFSDMSKLLSHFQFHDSQLSLCTFFGLNLKGTIFQDCKILECNFTNAYLENAVFEYCDLEKSIFLWCNFKNANLIWSHSFSINPENNKLHKTKFSREYCEGLLHHLDIKLN